MDHKELELRLQSIEKENQKTREKAEAAQAEAVLCRQVMKAIMDQNAEYKEKLIECGYLV
jgi:septal ring factor EnvC (AmiA/AmiB activator)